MKFFLTTLLLLTISGLSAQPLADSVSDGFFYRTGAEISSQGFSLADSNLNQGLINDPWDLIRGRIPGLLISRSGHNPNQPGHARLQGLSSLNSHFSPLVVVDGMPGVPLQSVDPNDIARMTLLSGPEALSMYGRTGAGGVLVIETHRPARGQDLRIRYQGAVSRDQIVRFWQTLDRESYLAGNFGNDLGANNNWQGEITQVGNALSHSLSASGTAGGLGYRAALHYRSSDGLLRNQGFSQFGGRIHLHYQFPNQRLRLELGLHGSDRNADIGQPSVIRHAISANPTMPIFGQDSISALVGGYFNDGRFLSFNPVWLIEQGFRQADVQQGLVQLKASYQWLPGIVSELRVARQEVGSEQGQYRPVLFSPAVGLAEYGRFTYSQQLLQFLNRYERKGPGISWRLVAGFQALDADITHDFVSGLFLQSGFLPVSLQELAEEEDRILAASQFGGEIVNYAQASTLLSGFGQASVSLGNQLDIGTTVRYDYTSLQAQLHPSFTAAWRFGQIKALQKMGVTLGSIRFSRGRSSYFLTSDGVTDAPFFSPYQFAELPRNVNTTSSPLLANKPDQVHSREWGLDIGTDTWLIQVGHYRRETRKPWGDFATNLPMSAPFGLYPIEDVLIQNEGWMMAAGLNMAFGKWRYQVQGQATSFRNSLSWVDAEDPASFVGEGFEFFPPQSSPGAPGFGNSPVLAIRDGGQIGEIYGPVLDEAATRAQGTPVLVDLNGDEFGAGATTLGQALPRWSVGLNQQLKVGGFRAAALLRSDLGHSLVNMTRLHYESLTGLRGDNRIVTPSFEPLPASPVWSDFFAERADYLALDYLSVGYTLGMGAKRELTVQLTGRNLFVITGYTGLDPSPVLTEGGPDSDSYNSLSMLGTPAYHLPGIARRASLYQARSFMVELELAL